MMAQTSGSLFGDDPLADRSLMQVLAHRRPADKAQQRFHRLVEKIELRREQLKQWQAYSVRYNQRLVGEMEPLRAQLRSSQREMVLLIDELLKPSAPTRRLGRTQRSKLRELLLTLAGDLLEDGPDEALEPVLAKYRARPDPQREQVETELLRALLNDTLGLKIDADREASSPEELLEHVRRKMNERAERQERRRRGRRDTRAKNSGAAQPASAEAAQARREADARAVSQSLRDVFRKLVSALHPDREPDPEARQRKTSLMQQVNRAYEANDLLTLLSLQLEIEQIDAAHLSSLSAERVAHYNTILSEQLTELEAELQRFVEPFRHAVNGGWSASLTTTEVDRQLSADIAELRSALRELQADLVAFRDPARLRERLKDYRVEEVFEEPDEPGALVELAEIFQATPPKRRRSRR